jgi:hypothetical protein
MREEELCKWATLRIVDRQSPTTSRSEQWKPFNNLLHMNPVGTSPFLRHPDKNICTGYKSILYGISKRSRKIVSSNQKSV